MADCRAGLVEACGRREGLEAREGAREEEEEVGVMVDARVAEGGPMDGRNGAIRMHTKQTKEELEKMDRMT